MTSRPWTFPKLTAATVALALTANACGSRDAPERATGDAPPPEALGGEILVSAAASLTDAFTEAAAAFEAAHPNVHVVLNLAGSSSLRMQILEGAPVDVFASANRENMDDLAAAGELAGEPLVFARNQLQIAVPPGNPAGVGGLDDFARSPLRLGLCAEAAPCGRFAHEALAQAGVTPSLDTSEPDVRALLTKVELGELDAGITYVTDVRAAAGRVDGVPIPDALNILAEYPVAVLKGAPNPPTAEAFVRFVLSGEGRAILARYGFKLP